MSNAPASHVAEAQKLNADTTIDLFEVKMVSGAIVRFYNGPTITWAGMTFENLPCQISGEGANSDGQYVRPTLSVANPDNSFGGYAAAGLLDMALVTRRRVLQQDLLNNVGVFQLRYWIIGRPTLVTWQMLQVELRDFSDIPGFQVPRRTFNPPEFPFVVLQ